MELGKDKDRFTCHVKLDIIVHVVQTERDQGTMLMKRYCIIVGASDIV